MTWALVFAKHAQKDAQKLAALKAKAQELLAVIKDNPLQNPLPYEKRVGDLSGAYSRRIKIQPRLAYEVLPEQQIVRVLRMWSRYELATLKAASRAAMTGAQCRKCRTPVNTMATPRSLAASITS